MKKKKASKDYNQGFTLVELMVVMAIMVMIVSIAVPLYTGYIERATKQVCNTNCLQLERMYHVYLIMENKEHTTNIFREFLQKYEGTICPANGDIKYTKGKVRCFLHSEDQANENEGDEDGGSVPFL